MMKLIILNVLFLFFLSTTVYSQDAQQIIQDVQSAYNDMKDATATFSKSFKSSKGKTSNTSGTFYIQKENKYRIETNGQTVVTDGKTSWSYSSQKKQVIIDKYVDSPNTFSPNKFLFDYPTEMYSDLEGNENVNGIECYKLKLTPRKKGNIKSALIWVDSQEKLIRKISITSSDGTTTYTLKSINLDPGIASSRFTFTAPNGTEVIDLR
ncbi:MAG: outer membrane lipoprotein carrier protein LolA [Ignavibacteriaceae bacterium]|jgi:Outer membrane lipoprotein-sorting protein|nr:MAG: outer membrane lipoprotein carrier protein LolA [Chlorobiota bacterium]KXK03484.1 MAG: Outer membrane lipoprotein-sorting protein [Chlorobi bacterium OLB4]MBV6398953.1 Outer-membrane lipoprotein carrier protein [Ignavibacteria bacterium]MCC6886209.1 outer membrane lipoprotein carrier protein LolA [Ignavibacteriales bacterium]MCE7953861.1 outer membrane lipoprotein carrier protein LolA [Chlorobi bacterium CHB7]MDL1887824.1 outer membrane lipoprotein carrier protein LolA [Ignavibacteria 